MWVLGTQTQIPLLAQLVRLPTDTPSALQSCFLQPIKNVLLYTHFSLADLILLGGHRI